MTPGVLLYSPFQALLGVVCMVYQTTPGSFILPLMYLLRGGRRVNVSQSFIFGVIIVAKMKYMKYMKFMKFTKYCP